MSKTEPNVSMINFHVNWKCKLEHVRNWLNLFVDYHNKEIINLKWTEPKCYFGDKTVFSYIDSEIQAILKSRTQSGFEGRIKEQDHEYRSNGSIHITINL